METSLDWYRVFLAVAECNNITIAAEKLFISQPAVSQVIRQLETNIGCSLFIRTKRGVKLTSEGELLYSYISKGLTNIALGEKRLKSMVRFELGELRIGASDMTLDYSLLPYLESFHQKYPNIDIKITNNPTPQTLELLNDDKIDFAIVSEPIPEKPNYTVIPLREIEDVFICGNKTTIDKVNINELPHDQFIMLEKATSTRRFIDSEFAQRGLVISPKFELATSSLLVKFAERNLGIACVMLDFAKESINKKTVRKIEVNDPLKKRKICLVNKNNVSSLAANRLISMIIQSNN